MPRAKPEKRLAATTAQSRVVKSKPKPAALKAATSRAKASQLSNLSASSLCSYRSSITTMAVSFPELRVLIDVLNRYLNSTGNNAASFNAPRLEPALEKMFDDLRGTSIGLR